MGKLIGYWVATGLFSLVFIAGGIANLLRVEPQRVIMEQLGYPEYLMTILGVAQFLGVVALLLPGVPLLKEWAYAGFTFDLLGAAASHGFAGHSISEVAIPLVILGIAAISYWLRPTERRIHQTTLKD